MKLSSKFLCPILACCLFAVTGAAAAVIPPFSAAASETTSADTKNTDSSAFVTPFDAAVITPDDAELSVSKLTTLDYENNSITMSYQLENTGSSAALCYIDVPVLSSLESAKSKLFEFSVVNASGDPIDFQEEIYFSSICSSSGINAESITPDTLHAFYHQETAPLPTDEGTLYTFSRDTASDSSTLLVSLSDLSEESTQIYPIGCSYTAKEGHYEISSEANTTNCYILLIGKEGTTYELTEVKDSGFSIASEPSSLDAFMELSCEIFLQNAKLDPIVDKDILISYLSDYLTGSSASVSLNLIPSLQWLAKQQLFEVSSCSFLVNPGESVTASIVNNCVLPVNAVSLNPVLTNTGKPLSSDQIHIIYKEDYTNATLRLAKSSYDKETSTYTLRDTTKGTYEIILRKTPIWTKSYRYIAPMAAVMILFLAFCAFISMKQKKSAAKQHPTEQNDSASKKKQS